MNLKLTDRLLRESQPQSLDKVKSCPSKVYKSPRRSAEKPASSPNISLSLGEKSSRNSASKSNASHALFLERVKSCSPNMYRSPRGSAEKLITPLKALSTPNRSISSGRKSVEKFPCKASTSNVSRSLFSEPISSDFNASSPFKTSADNERKSPAKTSSVNEKKSPAKTSSVNGKEFWEMNLDISKEDYKALIEGLIRKLGDSKFVKNLAVRVFGIDRLKHSSPTGSAPTNKKDVAAKPALDKQVPKYLKSLFQSWISETSDEASAEYSMRLKKFNAILSEKIVSLNKIRKVNK